MKRILMLSLLLLASVGYARGSLLVVNKTDSDVIYRYRDKDPRFQKWFNWFGWSFLEAGKSIEINPFNHKIQLQFYGGDEKKIHSVRTGTSYLFLREKTKKNTKKGRIQLYEKGPYQQQRRYYYRHFRH